MTKKVWHLDLEDGPHTVELDHGYFSGKKQIRVDGELVLNTGLHPFTWYSADRVNVGRHTATVVIRPNLGGVNYIYDLALDDQPMRESGEYVKPTVPAPLWTWLFIPACVIIGIWGGALAHERVFSKFIAVGAAVQCYWYLIDRNTPPDDRIRKCAVITLACLGVSAVLVFAHLLGWQFE